MNKTPRQKQERENTFSRISIVQPPRETAEQEIDWLKENYKLDFYLIRKSLIAAYGQRNKRTPDPKWKEVINYLKNY